MSREVIIKVRDDLDGSDADETIFFAYRGVPYEIDLSLANVELFDKYMDQFISGARKVTVPKASKEASVPGPRPKPVDLAVKNQRKQIRDWANDNGFTVDARGMIASTVFEAFRAAHPTVELLPGVETRYLRSKGNYVVPAVTSVTAQQANEGLISAEELLGGKGQKLHDSSARDREAERAGKAHRAKIRQWAVEQGFDQAPTGMVKQSVLDAYYQAHPEESAHGEN